jgi:hypothetical protein
MAAFARENTDGLPASKRRAARKAEPSRKIVHFAVIDAT